MTPRVHAEWRSRVAAEYRSAALTAQALHRAIQAAFPDDLLHVFLRVVRDELDHATLSYDCLLALGGEDQPPALDVATLAEPDPDGVLAAFVDGVLHHFCVGETLAVPLFAAMRRHASHPAVVPVLTRVLQDESVHRQLGWDALDELLGRHGEPVRARCEARLPALLAGFREAYAPAGAEMPLTDEERACGLIGLDTYRQVFDETLEGDLRRRFAKRGIPLPPALRGS